MLNSEPSVFSPDLGTLSILPREIRDRIYGYVLWLDNDRPDSTFPCIQHASKDTIRSHIGVLSASRRIYDEAKIVLYQINEFSIWINDEDEEEDYTCQCECQRTNKSVDGSSGFAMRIGHTRLMESTGPGSHLQPLPSDMLRYLQHVYLAFGSSGGIREVDIVPKARTVAGPERPQYKTLMDQVRSVCEILGRCHHLHVLRLSIRSIEKTPRSIKKVMAPICELRNIKHTHPTVFSMQNNRWVDWNLKGSYGRYMDRIMAMPYGAPVPTYVGDAKVPNQNESEIFDTVGATWLGGRTFDVGEEYDDYDDIPYASDGVFGEDEESFTESGVGFDDYDDFMDYMDYTMDMQYMHHERLMEELTEDVD